MNNAIIITLGHNSSVLYTDGTQTIGYEEERLNRKKSYSGWPKLALDKIEQNGIKKGSYLFISHWYDGYNLEKIEKDNHIDKQELKRIIKEYDLQYIELSDNFTHHDAHAYSGLSFYENNYKELDDFTILVMDGFGNKQEVISIYKKNGNEIEKIESFKGYKSSMGLMYQFATSFCGMKENEDEYKFLGYESQILNILEFNNITKLNLELDLIIQDIFNKLGTYKININEKFINLDELNEAKQYFYGIFNNIINKYSLKNENEKRIIIGYSIQYILENFTLKLLKKYNIKNIITSGGVFYNVKLNNFILKNIVGNISIIPVAGDQGAGIGLYRKFVGKYNFGDLCYGERKLNSIEGENVISFNDKEVFIQEVVRKIKNGGIVNIVKGNLEFGPRALCNTTTLALPTVKNVEIINKYNGRNTVMPMAPVINKEKLNLFKNNQYTRVLGSDKYMIITYDYNKITKDIKGVAHNYPLLEEYSGRPQVTSDEIINDILNELGGVLINTSFNVHGVPIVNTSEDALCDFKYQMQKAEELNLKKPYLYILTK